MKILHASRESRADYRYGMGRANAMLLDGLKQQGVSADFFCSSDLNGDSLQLITSQFEKLAKFFPESLRPVLQVMITAWETGRAAGRSVIAHGYTHLHCHDAVIAAGARAELKNHPVAWGISQHGYHCISRALHGFVHPLPLWFRAVLWHWERRVVSRANWVICPTASGRVNLARELRLSADARWHAIPHPLPILNPPEKSQARHSLGWSDELRYILAVGQLIPLKRFERIIDAMTSLPDDCRLVILGDGDKNPHLLRAERLGLPPPIMTTTDEVATYLAAADVFVSASATESFGMAILEAMAAGLPVISTNVGGVADVVGDAAELVNPDGSDLAAQMKRVMEDSELRAKLAFKSTQRIQQWPDRNEVAQRYLRVYENFRM